MGDFTLNGLAAMAQMFDRHAANVEVGTRLPQAAHRDAALACGYHSLAALRP